MRFVILLALLRAPLAAASTASLMAQAGDAEPGGDVAVVLLYEAAPGDSAVALEWEVTVPGPAKGFEPRTPAAGPDAGGKSLTCSGYWKKPPAAYAYRCILAGGRNPVANGAVAVMNLHVRPQTKAGEYPVSIDRAKGAMASATAVRVHGSAGRITVRPK